MLILSPTRDETERYGRRGHHLTEGAFARANRRLGGAGIRRGVRGGEEGVSASAVAYPAGAAHVWEAALGITIATGVNAWADQVGSVHFAQANTTLQPAHLASDLACNAQASVTGDGSNDYLVAAGSASVAGIKSLHDGTGTTLYIAGKFVDSNGVALSTTGSAQNGILICGAGVGSGMYVLVGKAGAWPVFRTLAAFTYGVISGLVFQAGTGRAGNEVFIGQIASGVLTTLWQGAYASAPGVGNAYSNLQNFAASGWAYGPHTLCETRIWTAHDTSLVELTAAHAAKYG